MSQPRKPYDKMQVLNPLYNTKDGISTGEFVEKLKCCRSTARTILVEMKREGFITETGVQTRVCIGKLKQSVRREQEGKPNNKNLWKITEAGKKYVENYLRCF